MRHPGSRRAAAVALIGLLALPGCMMQRLRDKAYKPYGHQTSVLEDAVFTVEAAGVALGLAAVAALVAPRLGLIELRKELEAAR